MRTVMIAALIAFVLTSMGSIASHAQSRPVGAWAGQVYLGSTIGQGLTWPARIQIPENGNGIVEYPSLNCRGILIPQPAMGAAQYLERIQSGKCPDNGLLTIIQHGDKLTYFWLGESTNHSKMTASASLSRVPNQQQASQSVSNAGPTAGPPKGTDPFVYCKAKRNTAMIFDRPGVPQDAPKVILDALKTDSAWWRCKDGEVYGCQTGASGRACARWDPSKKPTQGIREACAHNPNGFVSNVENDTPYSWNCKGTAPVLDTSNLPQLDKDGYYAGAWQKVSPPAR